MGTMHRIVFFLLFAFARLQAEQGYTELFNGHDLTGWTPGDNPKTWSVVHQGAEGAIVTHGPHSHLFYTGDFHNHAFKDFELKVDVMTRPGANGGVYIQTALQPGWPNKGFEIQVNNTYKTDPRKTFSIYEVKDVHEQLVPDNEWFTEDIIAKGDTITVKYNGKVLVEWTQPAGWKGTSDFSERMIGTGTIALQAHDPGSVVYYKNIRIKPLD
jgi:hypothetical protein